MGSSMSCVPQHQNFRFSSKSFIRRNSSRLFRNKHPQEGQEKSNSIINIMNITPRKDMSERDIETIKNTKWDLPLAYDPLGGWKKSSINVKNYGKMIHSSKVRFRFLHCQDVHDCYLDLFQTHLHFVSNNTTGLTYQGTLPLKELTICKLQQDRSASQPQEFAFQINGVSLNPIIVYCANQNEMDYWFSLLKEHIEANGGTALTPEAYTRVKHTDYSMEGREELRNSVSKEPIYEWEGSHRESLGSITYVTKVKLQHQPCQDLFDRLLVMYPSNLIILSEEKDGLFYKGKVPLNMITVTTPCQDVKPNTFKIEGKLINPIIVSCLNKTEFCDWIGHFKDSGVPVLTPPPPVYDIIYTPTRTEAPEVDRWSGNGYAPTESLRLTHQSGRLSHGGSQEHHFQNHEDNPLSPGYTEPLCYISSRPNSIETPISSRLGSRNSSFSSHGRPGPDLRPLSLRYSSPQRGSCLAPDGPLSPVYNMPYGGAGSRNGPMEQLVEKAPLLKSNSWSTAQTPLKYQQAGPQRYSDLCAPRKPLSPLYDDPLSPGMYSLEEDYVKPTNWRDHLDPHAAHRLPPSFRLRTPPLGRKSRNSQVPGQEVGDAQWGVGQRLEAVSRARMPAAPRGVAEQNHIAQRLFPSHLGQDALQRGYPYSPDENSYLKPVEPDDQEMDYDNIWDYDGNNGMSQPMSGVSPRRMMAGFGAGGVSAMATQRRWL